MGVFLILQEKEGYMRIVIAILLVLHGFITFMQAGGSFNPTGGVANPAWISWWPTNLGGSWIFPRLGVERTTLGSLIGILWLIAGAALIAAGLGLFGFIIPAAWWRLLAGIGAGLSLLLFAVYLHPFYTVGIGANLAILLVLLWARWPAV